MTQKKGRRESCRLVDCLAKLGAISISLRYGLVVRIAGSHPAGPGSIPGNGTPFGLVQLETSIFFVSKRNIFRHYCNWSTLGGLLVGLSAIWAAC